MNQSISPLFAAASLFLGAAIFHPADAFAGGLPSSTITVSCVSKTLPSQADVGKALGINNLSDAYDARTRLMVEVSHACRRAGATEVRVALASPRNATSKSLTPVAMESSRGTRR